MLGTTILLLVFASASALAQRVAIVLPEDTELDKRFAQELRLALSGPVRLVDAGLVAVAFGSARPESPFNMTTSEARRVGSVIGCDFYLLVRSGDQRRARLERPDVVESFAAVFVVSSRTGDLVHSVVTSVERRSAAEAEQGVIAELPAVGATIVAAMKKAGASEIEPPVSATFDEIPQPNTPAAENFRPPVPYLRIKPKYTRQAYLYDVTATVEAAIDLDEFGRLLHIRIVRWAGFGLDESVIEAIRSMNWRPAERNGKRLPVRFLVRYNFKKIEDE